ncbi:MAG: molybdenum cofactor guanylyltransferase MobA [Beijerinckiaceae bacterium]
MREAGGKPLGLILAGGLARRMGGGDKALIPIGGKTILAHVMERLGPQCSGLVLNANGDAARFAGYGLPVIADTVPGFAGPLAGILAGLEWARDTRPGVEWLVSAAADGPFLPRDLVVRLHHARLAGNTPLACAASGGWTHPVIGLWPVALASDLRRALVDEDMRKIDRWTARYGVATAEWPVEPADPFFNANEPQDIAQAEQLLALYPQV